MNYLLVTIVQIIYLNQCICSHIDLSNDDGTPISINLINNEDTISLISLQDKQFIFSRNFNKTIFHYSQYNDHLSLLTSDHNLVIQNNIIMNNDNSQIYFRNYSQWKLIIFEDFSGDKNGWSNDQVSSCGQSDNIFLGGYCKFGNEEVFKQFTGIPEHNELMIKFNFHFFDEWEGETAYSKLGNNYFWTYSYNWCEKLMPWFCKKYGINTCGKEDFPDNIAYPIQYETIHNESNITLVFGTNLEKKACDASWGIDDLQIFIR